MYQWLSNIQLRSHDLKYIFNCNESNLIQGPQKGDLAENDETLATPCANPSRSIRNLSQEHGQAVTMATSERSAVSKLHWK